MGIEIKAKREFENQQSNKNSLYNCIMRHPQVVQSPIFNNCLKLNIDDHNRLQFFPKLLLQSYVRELHNSPVSDPEDGGLKEERDAENNIIISNSTLCSLFPPQLKKNQCDTSSCVVVNVVYLPKLYIPNYYHGVISI